MDESEVITATDIDGSEYVIDNPYAWNEEEYPSDCLNCGRAFGVAHHCD